MKSWLEKNRHALLLLYFPVYLAVFYYLEHTTPNKIHILNCTLDSYIPFLEIFIVPYLLWFAFMGVAGVYFFFREKESFCKLMYFGMIGMTVFLIVSYFYPNGLELRPETFARDNIFVELTKFVYRMDTATNVLPSIHVFNSVAVCVAVYNSKKLKDKKAICNGTLILTVLIILSTMFVKQHSVVDVLSALLLSCISWELVYNDGLAKLRSNLEILRYRKKPEPRWLGK